MSLVVSWLFFSENIFCLIYNYDPLCSLYSRCLTLIDTHGGTAAANNRASEFIVYGLIWTPDLLSWTVNGNVVRTLTKTSTLENGLYKFPQTPSRIQLSVWPAGVSGSPPGVSRSFWNLSRKK